MPAAADHHGDPGSRDQHGWRSACTCAPRHAQQHHYTPSEHDMARSSPHSLLFSTFPFIVALLIAAQTIGVPTQAPAPTLYGVQPVGPDGVWSGATDISEFGMPIVGHVRTSSGAERAAVSNFGGYHELGTLGGAQSTALGAYYSAVVGQAQTPSGQFHAFRADVTDAGTGELVDLG